MSTRTSLISLSITRHRANVPVGAPPDTCYASWSRSENGKPLAGFALGLQQPQEAATAVRLIVRLERTGAVGFDDCIYSRQIEVYSAPEADIDCARTLEAFARTWLLAGSGADPNACELFALQTLMEVLYHVRS
jgi:hypothetical protein